MNRCFAFCLSIASGVAASAQFGAEQLIYEPPSNGPVDAVFADLDGDGNNDVVAISTIDRRMAWYPNDGTGLGGEAITILIDTHVMDELEAADLDNDGDVDLLVTKKAANTISWFRNTGTGSFSPELVIVDTAWQVLEAHTADLDSDGDVDVFAPIGTTGKLTWHANDGTGNFGPQQLVVASTNVFLATAAADLNGDGLLDIVGVSPTINALGIMLNAGGGEFDPPLLISTTTEPTSVAIDEFNGDGLPDIAVVSYQTRKLGTFMGNGDGTFGLETVVVVASDPAFYDVSCVDTGDLDGDGDSDLLFGFSPFDQGIDRKPIVRSNDGSGIFNVFTYASNPKDWNVNAVAIGQLDSDAREEALFVYGDNLLQTRKMNDVGQFPPYQRYPAPSATPSWCGPPISIVMASAMSSTRLRRISI